MESRGRSRGQIPGSDPNASGPLSAPSAGPLSSRASARDLLDRPRSLNGHDDYTEDPSLTLGMTERLGMTTERGDSMSNPGWRGFLAAFAVTVVACRTSVALLEDVAPNDNRLAAGTLSGGELTLRLEAKRARWSPDRGKGPSLVM